MTTAAGELPCPGRAPPGAPSPLDFFAELVWIDGRPLLATRSNRIARNILTRRAFAFGDGWRPRYNMALCGRAKKNWKTTDLCLAAIYRFLAWPSETGNDAFILANDEGQAADDSGAGQEADRGQSERWRESVSVYAEGDFAQRQRQNASKILPASDVVG